MINRKTSPILTIALSHNFLLFSGIIPQNAGKNIFSALKTNAERFTPKHLNMPANHNSIEKTIQDYIELREISRLYGKKRNDLEKEYNKLLTNYNGEEKNYSLEQADKIYKVYCEMVSCEEQLKLAGESFDEAETKLKEIGRILFEATIHAEVTIPAINGTAAHTRAVMVTYNNGGVYIH